MNVSIVLLSLRVVPETKKLPRVPKVKKRKTCVEQIQVDPAVPKNLSRHRQGENGERQGDRKE